MLAKSLFLILISVVYVSSYNVTLLKNYDTKTCNNEPSCDMVDDPELTAERRTLLGRPCMCDAACVIYRDCCTDSKYYNELEQSGPPPFYCSSTFRVYLKAACPETWTDEEVKIKCDLSKVPLRSDDTSLIIPVTNTIKNITYGNKYCALCHGDADFQPWDLSPLCGEAPPGLLFQPSALLPDSTTVLSTSSSELLPVSTSIPTTPSLSLESSPIAPCTDGALPMTTPVTASTQGVPPLSVEYTISSPTSKVVFRRSRSSDLNAYRSVHEPRDVSALLKNRRKRATKIRVNFYKYYKYLNDIWKTAKYDPYSTYFVTKYLDKDMICAVSSKLPKELKPYTRTCVPNTIEICNEAADPDTDKQCRSHTSFIYNKRTNKAYRNKYCATCDGVETTYLTGCPIIPRNDGA